MQVLGIDPGKKGGIVLYPSLVWYMMPVKGKAFDHKRLIEIAGLLGSSPQEQIAVYLEHVHAFPGQGAVSGFNFGRAFELAWFFGAMVGDVTLVSPRKWQGIIPRTIMKENPKDRAFEYAMQLEPEFIESLKYKYVKEAICDALLIAVYGYNIEKHRQLELL